jgi:DNA-binding transcriptional LysR family regulator
MIPCRHTKLDMQPMNWADDRIGRRIKLADLHVLMATVETGSMGKAAARLNTSQPAISRCIAGLELDLGVTLLERTQQGVEPTAYGRALHEAAASAFDSLRNGIQHIASLHDPTAGAVRIGGQEALITPLLPLVVAELRKTYSRLSVQVEAVAAIPQQYAELRERNIDLMLGRLRPPFESDVEAELLFNEKTYVVASEANSWSRQTRPFAFADLLDEPWALPRPGTFVSALFADAFQANGFDYPPRCFVTGTIFLQCELVANAGFLAVVPGSLLHTNRAGMEFGRYLQTGTLSCSPFQAAGTYIPCLSSKPFSAAATGRGRRHDHETTVDHALMRGLVTAGPVMRRGASSV